MRYGVRAMCVVALAVLACGAVVAQDVAPPWTYVEAGYLNVDPDALEDGGDNWFAGVSIGFLKNFHAFGEYTDGDFGEDNSGQTFELSAYRVGAGWHGLLGVNADLVGEISMTGIEIENASGSSVGGFDDDTYQLTGGVRWRLAQFLELDGFVNWTDYEDNASGNESIEQESYELRALLYVWRIAIGAGYETSDGLDQYNLFARFNFDRE